jgi:hypothetical protein
MDGLKVRDYVAAVLEVRDDYEISISDVHAPRVEDELKGFLDNPDRRDAALDRAKVDRDRGAARRRVDELFPFLRGRSDESHALPVITPAIPEDTRGVMLTLVRGESGVFDARIERALDDLGIRRGETFSMVIRGIS